MRLLIFAFLTTFGIVGGLCSFSKESRSTNVNITENISKEITATAEDRKCSFDFKNFTYPSPFFDKNVITLKNGEMPALRYSNGLVMKMGYSLASEFYNDLVNNEQEEAVIVLSMITGGSSQSNIIYVFDLSEKKPKLLWKYTSGDRANGGLKNVYSVNRNLVIETYEPTNASGDCCPKTYRITNYTWEKDKFNITEEQVNIPNPTGNAIFVGKGISCDSSEK